MEIYKRSDGFIIINLGIWMGILSALALTIGIFYPVHRAYSYGLEPIDPALVAIRFYILIAAGSGLHLAFLTWATGIIVRALYFLDGVAEKQQSRPLNQLPGETAP